LIGHDPANGAFVKQEIPRSRAGCLDITLNIIARYSTRKADYQSGKEWGLFQE
jgi:hypothetical protein